MRRVLLLVGIGVGLLIIVNQSKAQKNVSLYGKVTTVSGDAYTGAIKWGTDNAQLDEVLWVEMFNGTKSSNDFLKHLSKKEIEELSEKDGESSWLSLNLRSLSIWENKFSGTMHEFESRFGDIKSIEPSGRSKARVTLKNGVILEVNKGSSEDIGSSVIVYDFELGEVKLSWSRVEKVEFQQGPDNLEYSFGKPIFGIVNAGRKGTFKGAIAWDDDERFMNEILNGKDRNGDKKIPFRGIKSIEKNRNGVDLALRSGRTLFLTGSNDVNKENRGIVIHDPEIGLVKVGWRDFVNLEITDDESLGMTYDDFPVSKGLIATVSTIEGDEHKGLIAYDLDEAWEFEILDAKDDEVEFKIPFRNIKSIVPKNYNYSMVELRNGESLLLGDHRDVSDNNSGILIFPSKDADPIYIKWSKIDEIVFD